MDLLLERVGVSFCFFNVVKSEYSTNDLCDFGFLPERQYYDITENNGIIPHYDLFDRKNDP